MRIAFISAALMSLALPLQAQELGDFPTSDELEAIASGVVATHGDWEIRCQGEPAECRMFARAYDDEGNEVANLSMQALPEGSSAQLGAVVVTPLLTLLTRGVTMQVDGGVPASYPFSWCDRAGCYARFGLTGGQVDTLRNGTSAQLVVFSVVDQSEPVIASISLNGFTAALTDLTAR